MYKSLSYVGWYSFIEGIKNLIYWFPVIWRDRDFDQYYLYQILYKKLKKMEKFFRSEYAFTADTEKTADEIREVKEIVLRLLEDRYFADLIKDISTEEIFSIKNGRFNTNREHPQYKDWENLSQLADRLREEDKTKLFELIRERIDNWWD